MDCLEDLTGLNPLKIGSHDGYDRCDYLDPDSNVDILQDTDSDLNIVQLNIRGLIGNNSNCAKKLKAITTATRCMCSY